ncbi:chemotaxis protein CheW [Rhodoferax bucti]|uniref:chemotaxis protein CheW n=1 Tax=Rhodoferax bucti TaxID=2576305 RepID=UPI001108C00C|nr:chemotaxis protein CheW [Rhodoferax bucti]
MSTEHAEQRFGVFRLGQMQLALPIGALKEVTPMGALSALPSEAGCIIGAISLRGLMVPVLDLRLVVQHQGELPPNADVVVMEHEGRLLGLAADGVVGVYVLPADGVSPVSPMEPLASVLQAGFQRPDDGTLVSVLSPTAIARIPKVPFVTAPQNALAGNALTAGVGKNSAGLIADPRHLMLMRCSGIPVAMASQAVFTTLIQPQVQGAHMASGNFKGMMRFGEQDIPALDLAALCGFAPRDASQPPQAFLMQFAQGLVAFLVDEVVNVVVADGHQIAPVPLFANLKPGRFAGALPAEAIAEDAVRSGPAMAGFHLILDDAHMLADPHLQDVAAMARQSTRQEEGLSTVARTAKSKGFREFGQMVSYHVGVDVASPIQQIAEILTWDAQAAIPGMNGSSLLMSRGRPIPVYCLSALLGNARGAAAAQTSGNVLVVEVSDQLVGFRVPHLVSIGEGKTAPREASDLLPDVVLLGQGDDEKVLRLVDLQALARTLLV